MLGWSRGRAGLTAPEHGGTAASKMAARTACTCLEQYQAGRLQPTSCYGDGRDAGPPLRLLSPCCFLGSLSCRDRRSANLGQAEAVPSSFTTTTPTSLTSLAHQLFPLHSEIKANLRSCRIPTEPSYDPASDRAPPTSSLGPVPTVPIRILRGRFLLEIHRLWGQLAAAHLDSPAGNCHHRALCLQLH